MPEYSDNVTEKSILNTVYGFSNAEEAKMSNKSRILWQIIPCICGSLMCLNFGIMLGWPSPTYIILLSEESPLPISMIQSPMIAGFLMIGNIVATPFCTYTYIGSKTGILVALLLMTFGWAVVWQAKNVYFLLLSRLLIGLGQGFGIGQVRSYIKSTCEVPIALNLIKCLNIFIITGVVIAYTFGLFLDFRAFSLVSTFVSMVFFLICFFLPQTPEDLVRFGDVQEAKLVLKRIKGTRNVDFELQTIKDEQAVLVEPFRFCDICKNYVLRKNLWILGFMTFVQQFSGAPATIVYCQFMFRALQVPRPDLWAIIYGLTFLICNIIGIFCTHTINKRYLLFFSSSSVFIVLLTLILSIQNNLQAISCPYVYAPILLTYIALYTIGLGTVPFTLVDFMFPKVAKSVVTNFYIMLYSAFAVLITKLFQVFASAFDISMIFVLFASVSLFGCVFILVFIPQKERRTFTK